MSPANLHNASWWAGIIYAVLQLVFQLTGIQVSSTDALTTAGVLAALIVGAAYANGKAAAAAVTVAPTPAHAAAAPAKTPQPPDA